MERLEALLKSKNMPYFVILLSEVFPDKLKLMPDVDAYVYDATGSCVRVKWLTWFVDGFK